MAKKNSNTNDRWSALSMWDKADLIKLFIKNGVKNVSEMRQLYNNEINRALTSTDKNFVQRLNDAPNTPVINNEDGTYSTHLMASKYDNGKEVVFPTILQERDGQLHKYDDIDEAYRRASAQNDTLQMHPAIGTWYGENYKRFYPNIQPYEDKMWMYANGGYLGHKFSGEIDENDPNFIGPPRPVDNETLVDRQRYSESTYNDLAYNKGSKAQGAFQITPLVLDEYTKKTGLKGDLNDLAFNRQVRDWYMNERLPQFEMYTLGNPTDSIRTGRKYAAFNAGPGKVRKAIKSALTDKVDIDKTFDWLKYLPAETQDYVNFIVRGIDIPNTSKTKQEHERAYNKKFK